MSAKETALQVISKLANDVTWGQITDELYAAAVREGLDELNRGESVPYGEVKHQFDSCRIAFQPTTARTFPVQTERLRVGFR